MTYLFFLLCFIYQKCDTSKHKVLAVSLCPQSLPYFAAKFNLSVNEAAKKLCGFLKSLGKFGFVMVVKQEGRDGFGWFCFLSSLPVPEGAVRELERAFDKGME